MMRPGFLGLVLPAMTALTAAVAVAEPYDITTPIDSISAIVNPTYGSGVVSPSGQQVFCAIDNKTSKYLNFSGAGSGLIVNPASSEIVNGIRFYTADDSILRDPASYVFEGSSDGSTWTAISSGNLDLPLERNPSKQDLNSATQYNQLVTFDNSEAYDLYRVTFPTLRGTGTDEAMQIGEVELLTAVPEPSILGFGGVTVLLCLRRHR